MKKVLLSTLFFLFACILPVFSNEHGDHHFLTFDVHRQDTTFSSIFDCVGEHDFLGTVVKSSFRVRTNYDLYSVHGEFEGTGICRVLTLGVIFDWAREIDIYDKNDYYIGTIDGQAATTEKAKFSIYNRNSERVGIAYLDSTHTFKICDPNNENHYLAIIKRNFEGVDCWRTTVYDEDQIDLRILKVFCAFITDRQNSFN
ncbi:MAG: hypothetical protein H0T62_08590 [Parachlamydiaceae bacterium]|nr:hypothetical protein [Parachlamydiaceae bacterium]